MNLTKRKREVLMLVLRGMSNQEICEHLGLAFGTVKVHMHNLMKTFKVNSRLKLAVIAMQNPEINAANKTLTIMGVRL